jgi:hypothetical protein
MATIEFRNVNHGRCKFCAIIQHDRKAKQMTNFTLAYVSDEGESEVSINSENYAGLVCLGLGLARHSIAKRILVARSDEERKREEIGIS